MRRPLGLSWRLPDRRIGHDAYEPRTNTPGSLHAAQNLVVSGVRERRFRGDRANLWVKRPGGDGWERFRTATFNRKGRAVTTWEVPNRSYRGAWRFRWFVPARAQRSETFKIRVVGD